MRGGMSSGSRLPEPAERPLELVDPPSLSLVGQPHTVNHNAK